MKKDYVSPEFDVTRLAFEAILEAGDDNDHLLLHSFGEVGGQGGNPGLD